MIQPSGTTGFLLWFDPWRKKRIEGTFSNRWWLFYISFSLCQQGQSFTSCKWMWTRSAIHFFFSRNGACDGWIIRTAEQSAVFIPDLVAKKYNDDLVCEGHPIWTCISQCQGQPRDCNFQENQSISDPRHLHHSHHLIRVRASTKIAGVWE